MAIFLLFVLRSDGVDNAPLGVRTIALDVSRLLAFVALGIRLPLTLRTGAAPGLPSGHLHLFLHEGPQDFPFGPFSSLSWVILSLFLDGIAVVEAPDFLGYPVNSILDGSLRSLTLSISVRSW